MFIFIVDKNTFKSKLSGIFLVLNVYKIFRIYTIFSIVNFWNYKICAQRTCDCRIIIIVIILIFKFSLWKYVFNYKLLPKLRNVSISPIENLGGGIFEGSYAYVSSLNPWVVFVVYVVCLWEIYLKSMVQTC